MQAERFRSDSSGCTASDRSGLVGERQRECGGISGGALLRLGLSGERPSSALVGYKFLLAKTVRYLNSSNVLPHQTKSRNRKRPVATRVAGPWELALLFLRSWITHQSVQLELQKLNPAQTQFKVLCQAFFQESVPRPLP